MKLVDMELRRINLTNSSRQTFDTCRRKFFYGNVMDTYGIRLDGPHSAALLIGEVMHEMLAAKLRTGNDDAVLKAGWEVIGRTEEQIQVPTERLNKNLDKARALVPGFVEVASVTDRLMRSLGAVTMVEESMSMRIGTIQTAIGPMEVMYHGKLDVGLESEHHTMVVDHKSVSAFKASFYDRCQFDPQLTGYAMLGNQIDNADPRYVFPVAYNVIRKPMIRQKKAESEYEFAERLTAYFIETDPDEYMKLITTRRTMSDILELQNDLMELAADIMNCVVADRWRQSTGSCDLYSGCPYLPICTGEDDGTINFVTKTSTHEELVSSNDDW